MLKSLVGIEWRSTIGLLYSWFLHLWICEVKWKSLSSVQLFATPWAVFYILVFTQVIYMKQTHKNWKKKAFLILQYSMFKSTVVQYRSWYRCWLQWISKKSYWLEEREKGWDGRAEGSSAEETEGKLQFHSCLMLMAQVLLPCWIHFYLVVLMVRHISHVRLFATRLTVACQSPLLVGFSHQESWSGLSRPPPGDLPDSRIELCLCFLHCRQILYHWAMKETFNSIHPLGKTIQWCLVVALYFSSQTTW